MERRLAWRPEEGNGAAEVRLISGEPGEAEDENSLVGHVEEESAETEKIHPEDWQRNQTQLKRPIKPVRAEAERDDLRTQAGEGGTVSSNQLHTKASSNQLHTRAGG